jgi:hypothetical protein
VLDVDIDGQKIKYLSKQQYFDYIREEDCDYGGGELSEIKESFLRLRQTKNSSLHYYKNIISQSVKPVASVLERIKDL